LLYIGKKVIYNLCRETKKKEESVHVKKLAFFALGIVAVFALAACRAPSEIAMITDAGDIDDESFNQGTWEGIVEYAEEHGKSYEYYRPSEISDAAYIEAIDLAVRGGARIVITPGFLFEEAIYQAQQDHPDVKFVLIDGEPHAGDYVPDVADNTLSIYFAEEESGFLAGYAAVKEGFRDLGYMGGMPVPAVVRFGVGFIAGAYYAANEIDAELHFPDGQYVYLDSFDPDPAHVSQATGWYQDGVEIIFAAAGGAGLSVMEAAEAQDAWMIGVDVDQSHHSDTVLISAMKALAVAAQDALSRFYADDFPGGETWNLTAANDGVGLPMENSRFEEFDQDDYDAIFALLADGTIVVPKSYEDLLDFLDEHDLGEIDIEADTVQ